MINDSVLLMSFVFVTKYLRCVKYYTNTTDGYKNRISHRLEYYNINLPNKNNNNNNRELISNAFQFFYE